MLEQRSLRASWASTAAPKYPMNRARGRFVARRPSRLGQFRNWWRHPGCSRSSGGASCAAAELPREGGAAGPRAGYWKLVGRTIRSRVAHPSTTANPSVDDERRNFHRFWNLRHCRLSRHKCLDRRERKTEKQSGYLQTFSKTLTAVLPYNLTASATQLNAPPLQRSIVRLLRRLMKSAGEELSGRPRRSIVTIAANVVGVTSSLYFAIDILRQVSISEVLAALGSPLMFVFGMIGALIAALAMYRS